MPNEDKFLALPDLDKLLIRKERHVTDYRGGHPDSHKSAQDEDDRAEGRSAPSSNGQPGNIVNEAIGNRIT